MEDAGAVKRVVTDDNTYEAKTVILATGAKHRTLGVTGEEEYTSRGVSYCAVCDGAFSATKICWLLVAVILPLKKRFT